MDHYLPIDLLKTTRDSLINKEIRNCSPKKNEIKEIEKQISVVKPTPDQLTSFFQKQADVYKRYLFWEIWELFEFFPYYEPDPLGDKLFMLNGVVSSEEIRREFIRNTILRRNRFVQGTVVPMQRKIDGCYRVEDIGLVDHCFEFIEKKPVELPSTFQPPDKLDERIEKLAISANKNHSQSNAEINDQKLANYSNKSTITKYTDEKEGDERNDQTPKEYDLSQLRN